MSAKKFFTSLRGKLISLSIIPIIGLSIFMYFSTSSSNKLGEYLNIDHELLIPNLIDYGDVLAQRIAIGYYGLQAVSNANSPKDRKESMEKMKKSFETFKKSYKGARDGAALPEEAVILKNVTEHYETFLKMNEKFISDLEKNDPNLDKEVAKNIGGGEWQVLAKEMRLDVTNVLELYKKKSEELNTESELLRKNTKIKLLIVFLVVALGNILILFIISTKISNKMKGIIDVLNSGADKVGETSNTTAVISSELSSSVTETASALQETTSSVEETSSMIKRNAENAMQSNQVAEESKKAVDRGLQAVNDMTKSIEEISKSNNQILAQVEASNKEMQEIVKVITEIGNKTKLINDIVFQTKLLSFNASVEAARAGEQGKGFAVVAEEVGNLAKMSGESANEISTMLESSIAKVQQIANDTKSKVDVLIVEGKTKVSEGVRIAAECSITLKEINSNVEKVNGLVSEISSASQEQAQGMSEINKAMLELDNASSLNNQISQKVSASADELKSEVESIRQVIAELNISVNGVD